MARWPEWNRIEGREWFLFSVQSRFRQDVLLCVRAADAGVGASYCLDEVKVKYEVRRAFQPFTVVNFDTFFVRESL